MASQIDPPANPIGEFKSVVEYDESIRLQATQTLGAAPANLRTALAGLDDAQLDTRYRNWTIRQITHHLADSHLHSMIRFKWTLTEDHPTIKAYEEADWVELADSKSGSIDPPLALFEGLHCKWVQLLDSLQPKQFARQFRHPQSGEDVSLWEAIQYYAWHSQHHTGQINWVRRQNDW